MRKIMISVVVLILVLMGVSQTSEAQVTDTFTITVTVNLLAINLTDQTTGDYGAWAIGQVAAGVATTMDSNGGSGGDDAVHVVNTSNVTVDLTCRVSNQGAAWTVGGTAASEIFKLEAEAYDTWEAASYPTFTGALVVLTTVAQDIKATLASTTDQYVYFRFTAPTATVAGAQQTITVEIGAELP